MGGGGRVYGCVSLRGCDFRKNFVWGGGKGVVYEVSGCGVRLPNPISGSIFMFLVLIPVFMRFSLHCCGGGVY